jgi:hypothetical protein
LNFHIVILLRQNPELGLVKYLAMLVGTTDAATMRYFILAVALPLDLATVLLLTAVTRR